LAEYAGPPGLDYVLSCGSTNMPRLRCSETETQSFAERCFDLLLLFVQITVTAFGK
jgi:hypothetical protein